MRDAHCWQPSRGLVGTLVYWSAVALINKPAKGLECLVRTMIHCTILTP